MVDGVEGEGFGCLRGLGRCDGYGGVDGSDGVIVIIGVDIGGVMVLTGQWCWGY